MANIKARRKLSDLYKRGVEVRFGEGPNGPYHRIAHDDAKDEDNGIFVHKGKFVDADRKPLPLPEDEVQIWVQVPSSLHRDMAMRNAQAARAKSTVRAKREEDSEEHLTILAFLADMSEETLIEYVLIQENDERRSDAIREVLGEDEWKEMASYQDAIRELEESKTTDELLEDPDWLALMDLDAKFGAQVAERVAEMMDSQREALVMKLQANRASVEKKAINSRSDMVATQAFMAEYERQMLYYSIRDFDDNGVMFYESAREMAEQDEDVLLAFRAALAPFISDSAEAKNLQGVVSGLGSSEPPNEQETSGASTPATASA